MANIISVWSGPRNVSTALMYSFAQRQDTFVIDEPFYGYYLHQTGVEHPGGAEVLQHQEIDAKKVVNKINQHSHQAPVLFLKNMAHHLVGQDQDFLKEYENIFLIREPSAVIASLIHQVPEPELIDTAFKMQYDLLSSLLESGKQPVVVDSKMLLKNPQKSLAAICDAVGLQFDPAMLSWPQGGIEEDGIWAKHWYHNVHESTGFSPYRPKNAIVPDHLQDLLLECENYYQKLLDNVSPSLRESENTIS